MGFCQKPLPVHLFTYCTEENTPELLLVKLCAHTVNVTNLIIKYPYSKLCVRNLYFILK